VVLPPCLFSYSAGKGYVTAGKPQPEDVSGFSLPFPLPKEIMTEIKDEAFHRAEAEAKTAAEQAAAKAAALKAAQEKRRRGRAVSQLAVSFHVSMEADSLAIFCAHAHAHIGVSQSACVGCPWFIVKALACR